MVVVLWGRSCEPQEIPENTGVTGPHVLFPEPIQQKGQGVLIPHLHFCPYPMFPFQFLLHGFIVDPEAPIRGRGPEVNSLFRPVGPHIPASLADVTPAAASDRHLAVFQNPFVVIPGNIQTGNVHVPDPKVKLKPLEEPEPIEGIAADLLHRPAPGPRQLQADIIPATAKQNRNTPIIEPVLPPVPPGHLQETAFLGPQHINKLPLVMYLRRHGQIVDQNLQFKRPLSDRRINFVCRIRSTLA